MSVALTILAALAVAYVALLVLLLLARPRDVSLRDAARLVPDLVRTLRRLAADTDTPPGARRALYALLAYLAFPIDLVPDVVPVLGHADDVIVVALVLRWVLRRVGEPALRRHWPGSAEGLALVLRLAGHGR